MQELVAIPMLLATFPDLLSDAQLNLFVDNDGVLGAMLKGTACPVDMCNRIGSTWLTINHMRLSLLLGRVESAANVADAPSRDSLDLLLRLGAKFRSPRLPEWLDDMWSLPYLNAVSR